MTQANEPNEYDRQIRYINRRVERLEDTQISPQEFSRTLNRVYEEMELIRAEIAAVNTRLAHLDTELNEKIDTILRHITGQNAQ